MNTEMAKHLIPIGQASHRANAHPSTLKSLERKGRLTSYRDGRGVHYYDSAEIDRLRAERQPRPVEQGVR